MDALPFQPCVDAALLSEPPRDVVLAGSAMPVPVLVGTNLEEWRFYGLGDPKVNELDEAALLRRCERILPGGERAQATIDVIREARRGRGEAVSARDVWFAVETDRWFRDAADELAAHHPVDAWSYLFTWRTAALSGAAGACHSLEVPFVFGLESELGRLIAGDDPTAPPLCARMQDAWLAFAREGDPRTAVHPDWRPYTPDVRLTQCLGARDAIVVGERERERRHWEQLRA
jgi:para-nitrobenzyl esterase